MAGDASSHHSRRGGGHTDSCRSTFAGGAHGRAARPAPAVESDIRLTLAARPENIAVVRHVVAALADALALPGAVVDDMRLAVTEACTNVVRHAYGERVGSIDVAVRPERETLEIVVADAGRGMGPSPDTEGPGLGLPLIKALADSFAIDDKPATGSRLIMSFRRDRTVPAQRIA
ncbi:MAG TPA: ATP-binding protein [Solirubrobacteraceae bacterium]|nr:ATP-binding protein [Solirubrobacteraceae bacterium]